MVHKGVQLPFHDTRDEAARQKHKWRQGKGRFDAGP